MRRVRSRLTLLAVLGGLWLIIATMLYVVFVSKTDHTDFFPLWAGARLALFEGRDPYAPETTTQIQQTVYGHPRQRTEDQQGFTYPAHLIPLLLPFWLLPMRIASALWSSSSVLLAAFLIGVLAEVRWRLSWVPVLTVLTAHVLLAIFQGQFTIFVAACLGLGYWMYTHSRSALAGLLLVGTTIKPELVLLPIAALLAMALWERRLSTLVASCLGGLLMMGLSVAATGFWIPGWLGQIDAYRAYAQSVWPIEVLYENWPASVLAGVVRLGLGVKVGRWDRETVFATLCALNRLLLPQTLPYSLAVLVVPIGLVVLNDSPFWACIVAVASWGAVFVPYRIKMTAVPMAILGLVLLARHRRFAGATTRG